MLLHDFYGLHKVFQCKEHLWFLGQVFYLWPTLQKLWLVDCWKILKNFSEILNFSSFEKQFYFFKYLCTKFIVPSIGSIIHVGFSENDDTCPDPSEISSSPMNSWSGKFDLKNVLLLKILYKEIFWIFKHLLQSLNNQFFHSFVRFCD